MSDWIKGPRIPVLLTDHTLLICLMAMINVYGQKCPSDSKHMPKDIFGRNMPEDVFGRNMPEDHIFGHHDMTSQGHFCPYTLIIAM